MPESDSGFAGTRKNESSCGFFFWLGFICLLWYFYRSVAEFLRRRQAGVQGFCTASGPAMPGFPSLHRPGGRRPNSLRFAPVRQRPTTSPALPSEALGACLTAGALPPRLPAFMVSQNEGIENALCLGQSTTLNVGSQVTGKLTERAMKQTSWIRSWMA